MKTQGFTLVELLGVIIILSLLMLVVLPKITNSTRNSSTKTDQLTEDLIFKATDLYLKGNEEEYAQLDGSVYCVSLNELVEKEYLKSPLKLSNSNDITNSKVVEASYNNGYSYELKDSGKCSGKTTYVESTLKGAYPQLINGLTPVVYDGTNWKVADTSKEWYNYSNQEWANAVILNSGVSKNAGDRVDVTSDIKAMLVWIPRYEYKIDGQYGKGGTSADAPGEIEVNFISKTQTTPSTGYIVHPAFTFGSDELKGIWVGKFETSHTTLSSSTTANNLGCSNENCANADGLTILPNVASLRYNNVSNFFYAARSMTRSGNPFGLSRANVDTHMMKSSEWGAVAYLSQSKYGKYGNSMYAGANKEVYQNKSNSFITGSSNGTPSTNTTNTQCAYNDLENRGSGTGSCGGGASTTGNITGVYDMSGGSWEYVMGVYRGTDASSTWGATNSSNVAGFTSTPNSKYFDAYTNTDITKACNSGICYGHVLSETLGWYGDYAKFVSTSIPWSERGGGYSDASTDGVFRSYRHNGDSYPHDSFRIVVLRTTS